MTSRFAWVLNLDADLELAAGKTYAPSNAVLAAMAPHRARLAATLLAPDDVLLQPARSGIAESGFSGPGTNVISAAGVAVWGPATASPPTSASEDGGIVGRAFCPTPRALALLRSAGIEPEAHPSFEVLRAVNSRAFCAGLGQTLPGAVLARSLEEAARTIAVAPLVGRQWRAKPAFGMAGRGQRPLAAGVLSAADVAFLRACILRDGGIQLEPEVAIVRELAIHGILDPNGDVRIGRLVEQQCDASGQWLASTPIDDAPLHERLMAEARSVAAALHEASYFGPFGIDAFEYTMPDGTIGLQPRSELNARYSMGFAASGLMR